MIYTGTKRKPWDYIPWIRRGDLLPGDEWVASGGALRTGQVTDDLESKVHLLMRGGECAHVANDSPTAWPT